MSEKKLICKRPFEWLEISNFMDNSAWLCCSGHVKLSTGSAAYGPVDELWYGASAQDMRMSVVDGTFRLCHEERCEYLQKQTGPVQWVDPVEYEHYVALADGTVEMPGPKVLNASYDDSCNLRCPTCRDDIKQSSKEQRDMHSDMFDRLIGQFGSQLENVILTGSGDAFASRHCVDILKRSDVWDSYPDLTLSLMSNGLLLTPSMWQSLSHLHNKLMRLHISIDAACEDTYAINRPPGKWSTLTENMDFIAEKHREYPFELNIAFVVQQNNWREMEQFVRLGERWGVDHIVFAPVMNWGTYTDDQYRQCAVHLPNHPESKLMYDNLQNNPIFQSPIVSLSGAFYHYQNLIAVN